MADQFQPTFVDTFRRSYWWAFGGAFAFEFFRAGPDNGNLIKLLAVAAAAAAVLAAAVGIAHALRRQGTPEPPHALGAYSQSDPVLAAVLQPGEQVVHQAGACHLVNVGHAVDGTLFITNERAIFVNMATRDVHVLPEVVDGSSMGWHDRRAARVHLGDTMFIVHHPDVLPIQHATGALGNQYRNRRYDANQARREAEAAEAARNKPQPTRRT